jgi:hypothetical protein
MVRFDKLYVYGLVMHTIICRCTWPSKIASVRAAATDGERGPLLANVPVKAFGQTDAFVKTKASGLLALSSLAAVERLYSSRR